MEYSERRALVLMKDWKDVDSEESVVLPMTVDVPNEQKSYVSYKAHEWSY